MVKFKVGDKVKVVNGESSRFGKHGKVVSVNSDAFLPYIIELDGRLEYYMTREIEKVEEEMEYEVGKPYLWFGGECPLPKGTSVAIRYGAKDFSYIYEDWFYEEDASVVSWVHQFGIGNILMFKVMGYPKATRKVELELTEEEIATIKEVLGKVNL